jgi:hypothetical protein
LTPEPALAAQLEATPTDTPVAVKTATRIRKPLQSDGNGQG